MMEQDTVFVPQDKWRVFVECVGLPCPEEGCDGWMMDEYGSSLVSVDSSEITCHACGLHAFMPKITKGMLMGVAADQRRKTSGMGVRKLTIFT